MKETPAVSPRIKGTSVRVVVDNFMLYGAICILSPTFVERMHIVLSDMTLDFTAI